MLPPTLIWVGRHQAFHAPPYALASMRAILLFVKYVSIYRTVLLDLYPDFIYLYDTCLLLVIPFLHLYSF